MSELQEYRLQPLKRIAKVYRLPAPTKEELAEAERDRQALADQKALDELRRRAGLQELHPPPWYKRIARFYNENWEYMFEGVGPALIVIAMVTMGLLVFVQMGKLTGWWGGAW